MTKPANTRGERQERSSNHDIIGDRDFSIATSSVQSSVLKSSKFVADRGQGRGEAQGTKQERAGKSSGLEQNQSKETAIKISLVDLSDDNEPKLFKKKTIRSSTLKNDDTHHQVAQKLTKKQLPEGDGRKQKIKRGQTQKGEPGKAFPAESSDNGITLCKISESCLEELSIVESEALQDYEQSEGQGNRDEYYAKLDQQVERRKQKNGREQLSRSNEPQKLQELGKNHGNTQQREFVKNLNNQNARGPPSDWISIGSSSDFRQSNMGINGRGRSKDKLSLRGKSIRDKRDSSSVVDSQFSLQSDPNFSIGRSQGSAFHDRKMNNEKQQQQQQRRGLYPTITISDQKKQQVQQNEKLPFTKKSDAKSLPRRNQDVGQDGTSPLIPGSNKSNNIESQMQSQGQRLKSIKPTQNKALPKLPGFPLQQRRDQPKKSNGLSKELAQVTEKEEYDYTPMRGSVAVNYEFSQMNQEIHVKNVKNQNSGKAPKGQQQQVNDQQQSVMNGSDLDARKGNNSIADSEQSHHFDDSLMEQSMPHPSYGHDNQGWLNDTHNNVSGSRQITISTQEQNQMSKMAAKRGNRTRRGKSEQKSAQLNKDGNFRNIKDYGMFIPNQPKVNQVQGKSRAYLHVNDARAGPDGRSQSKISKASTRQLVAQSDMHYLQMPENGQPVMHKKMSGTMNSKALKNMTQNAAKVVKGPQIRNGGTHPLNRSVIQKKTTDESFDCYLMDNQTERVKGSVFQRMNTHGDGRSKSNRIEDQSGVVLQKQKTQGVTHKERQARDPKKRSARDQRGKIFQEVALNQIMFAQQAYLKDSSFEKLMIEEMIRNDKSKSQLKPKKQVQSAFKRREGDHRVTRPSRTGQRWHPPQILQEGPPDADIGYLESLAALGNEPEQNLSPEPRWDVQDQIYVNQNYSSIHSSTKNRKSIESLSHLKASSALNHPPNTNTRPRVDDLVMAQGAHGGGAGDITNNLPSVLGCVGLGSGGIGIDGGKSSSGRRKNHHSRQVQVLASNYANNGVMLPGELIPADIDKNNRRIKGGKQHLTTQLRKDGPKEQRNNKEILEIIRGLGNSTWLSNRSRTNLLDLKQEKKRLKNSSGRFGNEFHGDTFSGEMRTRVQNKSQIVPKIVPERRRLANIGKNINAAIDSMYDPNPNPPDLDEQRKALADRQPSLYYNAAKEDKSLSNTSVLQRATKNSPQPSRPEASKATNKQARYMGDPYSIPLQCTPSTTPQGRHTNNQSKFSKNLNLRQLKNNRGSPINASVQHVADGTSSLNKAQRHKLTEASRDSSIIELAKSMMQQSDAVKSNIKLSSQMVVPGDYGKISTLSKRKKKLLKPLDGVDKREFTQSKLFQDWVNSYNQKEHIDRILDTSQSPSSRNSKRRPLNQSVDQCYFNPEVKQFALNSSGPTFTDSSKYNDEQKQLKPSQLSAFQPDTSKINIQPGNVDASDPQKQQNKQNISLYFNNQVPSQRSRTSQQASRRKRIRQGKEDKNGGVENDNYGPMNNNLQSPVIVGTKTQHTSPLNFKGQSQKTRNKLIEPVSSEISSDYQIGIKSKLHVFNQFSNQMESTEKLDSYIQNLQNINLNGPRMNQRMNLSDCKYEMLTSNRSWRTSIGRVAYINNAALTGSGLAQVTSGMTQQAINNNKEMYINYRNQASRDKSRKKGTKQGPKMADTKLHVVEA